MGRIGAKILRLVAAARRAALATAVIGLAGSIGAGWGGAAQAQAAAVNCHGARDTFCTRIGPHPVPLSVPEFNRLAAQIQNDAKSAATLILFALLNAAEAPQLAGELGSLRLTTRDKATQDRFRRFVLTENTLAARCAASFVAGTLPPSYRYRSNAVAFWARTGAKPNATPPGAATQSVALCSSALGCISLDLVRDSDNGWLIQSPAPLTDACKKLQK